MLQFFDTLTDISGNALLGATLAFTAYPGGGAVTIYNSNGTTQPVANATLSADQTGQVSAFVPDGTYILTYSYKGTQYKQRLAVQVTDPLSFVAVADSGGSANNVAYTGSALSAQKYVGLKVEITIAHTNTGATTFVYQGDAGFPINLPGGSSVAAGMLQATGIARLEWDGTQWQLLSAVPGTAFYAQTSAEQAQGILPPNLSIAPGIWQRYGADTTGTNDSTQAVINAGLCYLKCTATQGTYKLTAGKIAFTTPVFIQGDGQGSTIINCTSASGSTPANLFSWSGSSVAGGGIAGFNFNATLSGGTSGGYVASNVGQGRWYVSDCIFGLNGMGCVNIQDANSTSLRRLWGEVQNVGAAINLVGSGTAAFNVCDISDVVMGSPAGNTQTSHLVMSGDVATVDIRHVGFTLPYIGILAQNLGNLSNGAQFITGYDCQVETPDSYALYLDGGTSSTNGGSTHQFTDCYLRNSQTTDNVYIGPLEHYVTLKSCQCDGAFQRAVNVAGRYVTIFDVLCANASVSGSASFPAIELQATSVGAKITLNTLGIYLGRVTTQASYGVLVDNGASRYIIDQNDCLGCVTGAILDNSNDANSRIGYLNLGFVLENAGSLTINSGTTTAVVSHGLSVTPSFGDIQLVLGAQITGGCPFVTSITSTQFTINIPSQSGNTGVGWVARHVMK